MPDQDWTPALLFFSEATARTVDAIAARVIPSGPDSPGAREAAAVIYIDRALAGYHTSLQALYVEGLSALDSLSVKRYAAPFVRLTDEQQDAVLAEIDAGDAAELGVLPQFFATVREQILDGTFCDPAYGGNRDAVGWKLVGFPGARLGYTAEEMQLGYDAGKMGIVTLADLRRQLSNESKEGK